LNILTGESNSGKTNLFRALRWLSLNKPLGNGMISRANNAASAKVTVTMRSGEKIVRERNKNGSINSYTLSIPGEEPKIYEGFGQEVPANIQGTLGIKEVDFGTKKKFSLNFASQLDSPFLLSETDTDAAKILGKLSGTEELDRAGKQVALDLYRNNQKEKLLQTEIDRVRFEIEKYGDLNEDLESILAISAEIKEVEDNVEKVQTLTDIRARFAQCVVGLGTAEVTISIKKYVPEAEEEHKQLLMAVERYKTLFGLTYRFLDEDKSVKDAQDVLNRSQNIIKASELANEIGLLVMKHKSLNKLFGTFTLTKISMTNTAKALNEWKAIVHHEEVKYTRELESLKICPMCGSIMEGSGINGNG
jgi:hypothetical protein